LGDLFQHNTGKALNRNGQTGVMHRYITTSNVYWDEFKLDDLRQMPFTEEELEKCSVKKGDLLVCEGGDIGRAAIWNFNQSICIQNHLHRLRPFVKVCVPFFCFVLRLYKATNRLQGRGIGLQGFSSRMLHNLPVPLPPLPEQKRIVAKIEELRAVIKPLTM
jgi:type I restriction enzyme S subunit